jgi:hypothetical protein
MTKNPYQVRVPPEVYEQAKKEQERLRREGINKPLWAIIAEKPAPKWYGGFRL